MKKTQFFQGRSVHFTRKWHHRQYQMSKGVIMKDIRKKAGVIRELLAGLSEAGNERLQVARSL